MWVQPNTSVVRAIARGQWQAPLGSSRPTTRSRAACRRARVGQGQAFGGAEEAPSLTLAARDGDSNIGRDGRTLATRVEQKNEATARTVRYGTLDNESPIQAVCGKAARTVLCGGRSVTSVPTASRAPRSSPPGEPPKQSMG